MQIADKVFVVTGGGNGIGREVVLGLLSKGARGVAAVDLSADGLAETAALANAGERLMTIPLDITDRKAVDKLPAQVKKVFGQLDSLVNVAGIIQKFVPISELSIEEIERVMNVNFWGVVNTTKAFLPELLERPVANITNVASMGGFIPFPGQSAYGASKAAVKLFTEGLYAELHDGPVEVVLIFPGAIGTEITKNSGVASPGEATADTSSAKTMPPAQAADEIITAIQKGSYKVMVGKDAKMLDRMSRLMPQKSTTIIANQMKKMMSKAAG